MLRLAAELLASVGCVFGLGDMARCRAPARRSRHGQGARAAGEDGRKGSGRPWWREGRARRDNARYRSRARGFGQAGRTRRSAGRSARKSSRPPCAERGI